MESISYERMSPDSEEYKERYKKERVREHAITSRIFGALAISQIESSRNLESDTYRKRGEERNFSYLKFEWATAFRNAGSRFLAEMFSSPELKASLLDFLISNGVIPDDSDFESTVDALNKDEELCEQLPNELIEAATRGHIERKRAEQEAFEKTELPQLLDRVNEYVTTAIEQGILPVELERWIHTRDSTVVMPMDEIMAARYGGESYGGYYPESGIHLNPKLSPEEKVHTLTHEFFHALSGNRVNKTTKIKEFELSDGTILRDENVEFDHQRSGLGFSEDDPNRVERFKWLNEAMTERLAVTVAGAEEAEFYKQEIELANVLEKNLGEDAAPLFTNAYFENFKPEAEDAQEHFRRLIRAIDAKFGPQFLVKLDKFIHEQRDDKGRQFHWMKGVEIALDMWNTHGDNFPQFLEDWIEERRATKAIGIHIVDQLESSQPDYIAGIKSPYVFRTQFDELWESDLKAHLPEISEQEAMAVKYTVLNLLLKKINRQTKRH